MARAVFFHPPIRNIPLLTLPLAFLHLATGLDGTRHRIRLVDGRLEPDPIGALLEALPGADVLLVTTMPGSQVEGAVAACTAARQAHPDLPIVWGGTLPSLEPATTLRSGLATAVMVGRCDRKLAAVLDALDGIIDRADIPDVWWQSPQGPPVQGPAGRRERQPPRRPRLDLLASVEPYICQTRNSRRMLDYISSFGCPHLCTFCSEPMTSGGSWSAMDADILVDAVADTVDAHGLDGVLFQDAKFTAHEKRLVAFCNGLLERDVNINWIATACGADIQRFHANGVLKLMRRAGCEQLFIGAEAASPDTLAEYRKTVDGEESFVVAELLWNRYGILPHYSYVIGHPIESLDQVQQTLDLHEAVCDLVGAPTGELGYYAPVPGTAFLRKHIEHFNVPDTLIGWARFNYFTQDLHKKPSKALAQRVFAHHLKIRRKYPHIESYVSFDVWQEQYFPAARRVACPT